MKTRMIMMLGVLALVPALVFAQAAAPQAGAIVAKGEGQAAAVEAVELQGVITAIDAATRGVTIKGGSGAEWKIVAGAEVKNFAQLKVGDLVTIDSVRALKLVLKKGGKALRERREGTELVSAKPGEKPMGAEVKTIVVIADVTAVNKKKGVVTLRGPKQTVNLHVQDKEMLKNVAVGDQVEATFVEAVMIKASAAPKK